jgi:hypothetical protein
MLELGSKNSEPEGLPVTENRLLESSHDSNHSANQFATFYNALFSVFGFRHFE